MTDTARDLERVLTTYADRADPASSDLADLVEHRYRRHRQRKIGATAAGLAAIVAAAVLSVSALHIAASPVHPATPPSPSATGPSVPPTFTDPDHLRLAYDVWPQATVTIPDDAPDGKPIVAIEAADTSHVLVRTLDFPYALYSYDTVRRTFRELTPALSVDGRNPMDYWTVTAHWVVYGQFDGGPSQAFALYRVPLSGGAPRLIGSPGKTDSMYNGIWYADDTAVYWSDPHHPGVMRMPLSGGSPRRLPGFERMWIVNDSGWAVQTDKDVPGFGPPTMPVYLTREMRNLATGATITVTAPPNTGWLQCTPTLCVGGSNTTNRIFTARPDGTGQTWLDRRVDGGRLWSVGGVSVITDGERFIYDPATGLIGSDRTPFMKGSVPEQTFRSNSLMGWSDGTEPAGLVGGYPVRTLLLLARI